MTKKLKFIMPVLFFYGITAYAQTAHVSGNITGLKDKEIYLYYYQDGKSKTDTVKVTNGQFKWSPKITEPQKVGSMIFKRYYQFFVESGNIKITGGNTTEELKITGSKSQDEYEAYEKTLKDLDDQESPLYQKWGKVSKDEQVALEEKVEDLRNQRRARNNEYIKTHPNSPLSISMVSEKAMMGSYADVALAFKNLAPAAQQSEEGKRISERLVVLKRSAIGEPMLNFKQNDTEGKPVQFSDFKGKYVLVDFWASWCGPCRAENPNVLKAYNQYKDKNFTVVGVSLDDKGENWKKAIKDDKMPWTQVSDLKGWKNEVSTYYGIMGIPSTLLIDPQGNIIAKDLRGVALNKKLAELFN